ncbi:MAG: hypothetical protein EHM81_09295, partial [Chloroflexi bacterium]
DEYDVGPAEMSVPLKLALPGRATQTAQSRLWFDLLRPTTSQALATYQAEYFSGSPAVTLNEFGKGQAVYVGTLGDDNLHDTLLDWAVEAAKIPSSLATPPGVEATERWQGDRRLLFLLNHTDSAKDVQLSQPGVDLLSGAAVKENITLPPYGVVVLE